MTYLVPFDGSPLSTAALARASEFAGYTDAEVVVLTVIPEEPDYALARDWLGSDQPFDVDTIATTLEERARSVAPDATFRAVVPEETSDMASTTMDVVRTIREVAAEVEADVVFVGSENAGRVSTPLSSVGAPVSEDPQYDVHIVRHAA